jgi:hypothetical protein
METTAESTGTVEAPEVDSEAADAPAAGPAPAAVEDGDSGDDMSEWTVKAQRSFNKLTRKSYENETRAVRAETQLEEALRRLAEHEQRQEAKQETVAPSKKRPTLESCGYDEDKFNAAVDEYNAELVRENAKAVLAEEREAAQREQSQRDWERKQNDFIKSKPDYADKVGNLPRSLMTDALAAEIKETGNPEIAYYLAENVAKLAEIAQLPPKTMAREIGRIEARLEAAKATPAPAVSKAPPPVAKVEASESVDKDPSNMSDAEFAKWRKRQIAQRGSR